jgi:hypothetical protein
MKLTTTIATLALSAAGALAQCGPPSLRPPVGGGCPQGWQAAGRYCTPSERAQDVIVKPPSGVCPFGWTASASYCLRSGDSRR